MGQDHQNVSRSVQADLIDKLSNLTLPIMRANSLNSMTQRFFDALMQFGVVESAVLFEIHRVRGKGLTFEKTNFRPQKCALFNSRSISTLQKLFANIALNDAEFRRGAHLLELDGKKVCFCTLGDSSSEWRILCWQYREQHQVDQSVMDYFVNHLQSGMRWLLRLDKTQALIYRDDLTGLFNGRFLEDTLEKEVRRSSRFETVFSLLFIDLDDFKSVNDKFGHLVGSDVLKQTADLLRSALRDIDSVIRYGGDEFIVLLLGSTSNAARLAAERIRRIVENNIFVSGTSSSDDFIKLTCSIGIAAFPEHATDKEKLLKIADECMYKSKRAGKNSVHVLQSDADSKGTLSISQGMTGK